MSGNIWTKPETFVRTPEEAVAVLRQLNIPQISQYLETLSERGNIDLQELKRLVDNSLISLSRDAHLKVRRVIAPFFSKNGLSCWKEVISLRVEQALEHLQAAQEPDLVVDFTIPLFLKVVPSFLGLSVSSSANFFGAVKNVQRITEPYLSLTTLKQMNDAVRILINACPDPAKVTHNNEPESLLNYLSRHRDQLPSELDSRYMLLGLLSGAYTAVQSLGLALYGLLTGPRIEWIDAASPDWAERELERVLSLYQPTRTLVREVSEDTNIAGCPYHKGQYLVLDIVDINTCLRNSQEPGSPHISFGRGHHKCPGSEFATMLLSQAIPALAKRFPELLLHKEACKFIKNPMIQAPKSLPCDIGGGSRRVSSRMCDIREMQSARQVVTDNINFRPPRMEEHLTALAERSGSDLSTAISIARNAMFFMDGERHLALRRAIADKLGKNRLAAWDSVIDTALTQILDELETQQSPDLAKNFADRLRVDAVSKILGITSQDPTRFEVLAPSLQDVLTPWLPMRELERMQGIFHEALALLDTSSSFHSNPPSLLQSLLAAPPDGFTGDDLKAAILVLYGATFTLSHTLANILHWILTRPPEERALANDPSWIDSRLEQLLALCPGPKYIYRMVNKDLTVAGVPMRAGDTARLPLLTINRGVTTGHMSFGHGLHRCIGAALSRQLIRRAIPALFSRFPNLTLIPQGQVYYPMSQTVALHTLPCRFSSTKG